MLRCTQHNRKQGLHQLLICLIVSKPHLWFDEWGRTISLSIRRIMESSDGDAVIWPHCFRTPQDFPCPSPSTAVGCLEVHSAEASGNSSKAILTVNQQQLLEEMWSIWRRQVFLHPQFMLSLHRTAIRGHLWVLTDLFLQCDYNKFKGFQIDTD